jgi:TolB-like protein/class 3 adenylate cyclase
MITEGVKRKLTAILSADVKGYSRLMGEDEDATVRTLTAYRTIMVTLIQKHQGRVVDSPGDNLLAEFSSVLDAVRCAVEIQEELRDRNTELPENRKMEFRIGINLGDIIEEGGRIYGDGVNIAARMEGLAEGGGICISGTVYEHVKNKLAMGFDYLGRRNIKNITEPVQVYRVWMEAGPTTTGVIKEGRAGLMVEVASREKMAFPLPDKPSIAVLPFVNMSGDPDQEYFSDGLTEDLITDLSKTSDFFVVARNLVFPYKGKAVRLQQVSRELGVRYIVEGSVRKAGDKVRITAQFVDAITGGHLWAERYDRDLKDVFAVQDEIVQKIVTALQGKILGTEIEHFARTGNL